MRKRGIGRVLPIRSDFGENADSQLRERAREVNGLARRVALSSQGTSDPMGPVKKVLDS